MAKIFCQVGFFPIVGALSISLVNLVPVKAIAAQPIPLENFNSVEDFPQLLGQTPSPGDVPQQREPRELFPPQIEPPSTQPPQPSPPQPLPPPEELLEPQQPIPEREDVPDVAPQTFTVEKFNVVGSTIFSPEQFEQLLEPFTNRPLSLAELFQARSAVTQLYVENGYITSGAILPPQELTDNTVTIQVIEGGLEAINVTVEGRLKPEYIEDRIDIATQRPLNVDQLLEALQLLRLDPVIANLSAELSASPRPGLSVLDVQVAVADTFSTQATFDNGRSPSVGTLRRRLSLYEGNLGGYGDSFSFAYTNTEGSDAFDTSYTLPINARNGSLKVAYGTTSSEVIEPPFDEIDIESESRYYEFTYRQPIYQTPSEEFAMGITASRQESESSVLGGEPFPLSLGADEQGKTRVSALRFFQEWTRRSEQQVVSARSQLSVGANLFNATINEDVPDSRFLSWRGQGQWVRLLAEDTLLFVRTDIQLANQGLLSFEQIGFGGLESVRGYRQDVLLSDNGFLASAELRYPIARIPQWNTVVQVTPFFDFGKGWNNQRNGEARAELDPDTLASIGLGLRWQTGNNLTARLEWGIPLINANSSDRTWQENGLYFSLTYSPF
ncbi:MAG: ShlB/FhaC/HecB family hemolysin secretion/activation protein [Chroococcales cyanobacterium]